MMNRAKEGIRIKGTVTEGLKEGRYFLLKEGYTKQIKEKLGFAPYPGTLNIKTEVRLPEKPACVLEGFSEEGKEYGDVLCYEAVLLHNEKEVKCFVVRPLLSSEKEVIEIIHEKRLRSMLGLEDGDEVELWL